MRRVNLLPPEERRRAAERLRSGVVGVLLIAGAVAIIFMVAVYLVMYLRLGGLEDQIAELDDQIAQQNGRLAQLRPYGELQARLQDKKPVADGIFRTRFAWDQFLDGLSFVIPDTTALETFSGEAAPVDLQAPVDEPLEPPGAITFTGFALPCYTNVADFVVRMNNLRYLANAELDSAELDTSANVAGTETTCPPADDATNPLTYPINFEVNSELVTVVGENGTEVRIEGGTEVARGEGGGLR